MPVELYIVDAFASVRFIGTPAAVCLLRDGLDAECCHENELVGGLFFYKSAGWGVRGRFRSSVGF